MQPRDALKWSLIRSLGYRRFLIGVFYYRHARARLAKRRSDIYALTRLIQPNHVVLDVGANIGYTAAVLSSVPSKCLYAFEPDPDNFDCLSHTLRTRKNIVLVPCGVGAADGFARLDAVSSNGVKQHALSRLSTTPSGPGNGAVSVRSIDSFGAAIDGTIGLIKIDVEGFEIEVLHGMTRTIARDRPSLYVEVCGDDAIREYNAFAAEQRYSIHRWAEDRFLPVERMAVSGNYLFTDANAAPPS